MHRLAAAGGEELVHLGCTDGAGQELVAEGKAAPECFELELGGIGGGGSQPIGERAVCLGAGGAFPRGHRGQRLQQCCLGWRIERRTAKLVENSGLKLSLWGHELRQEPCSAQPQTVRDVRASCHAAGQSDGCCFTCGQDQVSEDVGVEQLDHRASSY